MIFYGFDRGGIALGTLTEVIKRPYLMVGTFGLVLMVPLAASSTNGMIRRLGGKRWKLLHRATYLAAIAGAVHYYMLVKADFSQPLALGAAVAVLLVYRVVAHYVELRSAYHKLRSTPAVLPLKPKFWTGQLRVARIFQEASEVRTFRLAPLQSNGLPFDFLPGQYLNLVLDVDGKKVRRSYTIASSPSRSAYCEITVKREPLGTSFRHLHDQIAEGSRLDLSAPAGRFTFTGREARSIVLIAGGVGITPLMSKIRYLTDTSWSGEIHLIFAVQTEQDIIFREELDALQRRFPNLHVTITTTRDQGSNWTGPRGRLSPDLLNFAVPSLTSRRVHICGPDEMMKAVVEMLKSLDMPDEQIYLESFTRASSPERGPSDAAAPEKTSSGYAGNGSDSAASITFARTGKSRPISVILGCQARCVDEVIVEA